MNRLRRFMRGSVVALCLLAYLSMAPRSNASEEGAAPFTDQPAMSPDGTKLAFISNLTGESELWIADGNGANPHVLLEWPDSSESWPDWSPDGSQIVFSSNQAADSYHLWVVNADGTDPVQLTFGDYNDQYPRYSPLGTAIAFASDRSLTQELWVMNSDGSDLQQLTDVVPSVQSLSWSPDGQKIVYSARMSAMAYHLFAIDADGSNIVPISTGVFLDQRPDWGPAGILFDTTRDGDRRIWLIQPDGSGLAQVTDQGVGGDSDVRWVGSTNAFVFSRWGGSETNPGFNIWHASSQGAAPEQITYLGNDPPAAPTNLVAMGGNGQVSLNWTPSLWAAGYNVYRSTASAGPYEVVIQGTSYASYVDDEVTNGQTYFYIVTAFNGLGESPSSNEASATPR